MLAGLGIVSFEQAAMAELGTGHARDHDAVHDQRRAGHGVAIGMGHRIRRFHRPDLLAGLGIESRQPIVHERANDHPLVDRGAAIDDAAADDAQGLRRIIVLDLPDLLAGHRVHGRRRVVGCNVDHAVLDDWKAFSALQVGERIAPDRHQLAHVLLVDLGERAVAVSGIAHPVDEHVARGLLVVLQIVRGLGERHRGKYRAHQRSQQC